MSNFIPFSPFNFAPYHFILINFYFKFGYHFFNFYLFIFILFLKFFFQFHPSPFDFNLFLCQILSHLFLLLFVWF